MATWWWGNFRCSPGQKGSETGAFSNGSSRRVRGEGRKGKRGRPKGKVEGISENGTALPALVLADLQASTSGHLEDLPHPLLGLS